MDKVFNHKPKSYLTQRWSDCDEEAAISLRQNERSEYYNHRVRLKRPHLTAVNILWVSFPKCHTVIVWLASQYVWKTFKQQKIDKSCQESWQSWKMWEKLWKVTNFCCFFSNCRQKHSGFETWMVHDMFTKPKPTFSLFVYHFTPIDCDFKHNLSLYFAYVTKLIPHVFSCHKTFQDQIKNMKKCFLS